MRKKEKRNRKSITIAEIISLKQNPRTRQPRTPCSRTLELKECRQPRSKIHCTCETQAKEVLLLFDEERR